MKIGILETGRPVGKLKEDHGGFPDMMRQLLSNQDLAFETYAVLDDQFPASVVECQGWLITGSRNSAYDDLDWIRRLEQFLRDAYAAAVPIVGICFGHQVLARALGGKVERAPQGWGVGPMEYDFGGRVTVINAWHQDQVTEIPGSATRIATSPFCENAALLYGKRALTYQAHPEFTPEFVRDLIELRRDGLPAEVIDSAEKAMARMETSAYLADEIGRFFRTREISYVCEASNQPPV